jgi:hypothetical protein
LRKCLYCSQLLFPTDKIHETGRETNNVKFFREVYQCSNCKAFVAVSNVTSKDRNIIFPPQKENKENV